MAYLQPYDDEEVDVKRHSISPTLQVGNGQSFKVFIKEEDGMQVEYKLRMSPLH